MKRKVEQDPEARRAHAIACVITGDVGQFFALYQNELYYIQRVEGSLVVLQHVKSTQEVKIGACSNFTIIQPVHDPVDFVKHFYHYLTGDPTVKH